MARIAKKRPEADVSLVLDEEGLVDHLQEKFGEHAANERIEPARNYISTRCASLDYAIGRAGVPVGRVINFYGQEGSSKSTTLYHILAETQHRDGFAVLWDAEGAYDRERGDRMGINFDRLIRITPSNMEEGFDEIVEIVTTVAPRHPDKLITIGVDSVAACVPKAELEGNIGDVNPGIRARVVSTALAKVNEMIKSTQATLILVGQLRNKLEFGGIPGAGPRYTQIAEQSIKFYSSLRVSFVKVGTVGDKDEPEGIEVLAKVEKNKVAPPYKKTRFVVTFWDGVDRELAMLDVAEKIGRVHKSGSWYEFDGKKFRASDFVRVLTEAPSLVEEIKAAPERWVREHDGDIT